ncbi:unnamed protein product [Owenia fusiformis]|uniref:Uncharacterized protein n=1 Tax=Owenia fusiformis TaxID=6347 RepID=A0A8J1TZX5_OWEFU|nr:unnamed protein product [Owenia fusiformis]
MQPFAVLVFGLTFGTILAIDDAFKYRQNPPSRKPSQCTDEARNCGNLNAGSCTRRRNERLCCATCWRYLVQNKNNPRDCPYGDSASNCASLSPRSCSSSRNKRICCSTCARYQTDDRDCPYGDSASNCGTLSPGDCYSANNRDLCCSTCKRLETGDPSCKWGDNPRQMITDNTGNRLPCRDYALHMGFDFCRMLNAGGRQNCCVTCKGHF